MSVTSVEPINDNRSGNEVYNEADGTSVKTSRKAWRVHTSSNTDDEHDVLASALLPKIGTAHSGDANSRCIGRQCNPESHGQKRQWIFVADYSNKYAIEENPLNDPAKTEWSTETFQTPIWEDVDGNGIVNSAGDPFDPPPEKDDSRWTSITRKNVLPSVPNWIFAYQDGVNSDSFTIDGVGVEATWAKVSAIHLGEVQERNDTEYRVLTVTIHYRGEGEGVGSGSGSYGSGSGTDAIEPWDLNLLDQGFREIDDEGSGASGNIRNIKNADGEDITAPVPLDGEGHKIVDPSLENSVFLQFQVYRQRAFSLIESMFS